MSAKPIILSESVQYLRGSLPTLSRKELEEILLRMTGARDENKAWLTYFIDFREDPLLYAERCTEYIAGLFEEFDARSLAYRAPCSAAFKVISRYKRFSGNAQGYCELILAFLEIILNIFPEGGTKPFLKKQAFKATKLLFSGSKKIHPDLLYDYSIKFNHLKSRFDHEWQIHLPEFPEYDKN